MTVVMTMLFNTRARNSVNFNSLNYGLISHATRNNWASEAWGVQSEIYYSEVGLETEKIANYVMKPSALPGIKEAH